MAKAKALPARPNLDYLRKLAKQRLRDERSAGGTARLSAVQLAVAREYGFASWRQLQAHISQLHVSADSTTLNRDLVDAFLNIAVPQPNENHRSGSLEPARRMLDEHPALADADIYAAAVVGNHARIGRIVRSDPAAVNRAGGVRGWPPLCYLTFSRFLRLDKTRSGDFVQAARVLLDAGADPNSSWTADWNGENVAETALYGACGVANDPRITKLLLDHGARVDSASDSESLYHATEFADHACLKLLLAHKPEALWVNYCMCHMMDREDPAGLRIFLDHGADPNYLIHAGSVKGRRPLHFAILRNRSARIIRILINAGADPNRADADGETPYALACRIGHKEAADVLLKNGANDNLTDRQRALAAVAFGNARRARALIPDPARFVRTLSDQEKQLLPHAVAGGRISAVKLMLELGFDINARSDWGGSAIHQAAVSGKPELARLLIKRGADLKLKNNYGGDALGAAVHAAVNRWHDKGLRIMKMIAQALPPDELASVIENYAAFARSHGADDIAELLESLRSEASASREWSVDRLPEHRKGHKIAQWKPLMDAAFAGDIERARKLLDGGADPNCISSTPHRYRPLLRAIEHKKTAPKHARHEAVVKLLLERGADPKLRGTRDNLTALQLAAIDEPRFVPALLPHFQPLDIFHAAAIADQKRVALLLKNYPALSQTPDANGWTALHYAAASGAHRMDSKRAASLLRIAGMLLDAGADVMAAWNWHDKWPLRPLYYACGRQSHPAMTELLLQAGADPCDNESIYHASDEGHRECLDIIKKYVHPGKLAAECTKCLPVQLRWRRTKGMKWLLEHGADPNVPHETHGNNALHEAVLAGASEKVIATLLEFGAKADVKNRDGKTAVQLAQAGGKASLVKLLTAGANGKQKT